MHESHISFSNIEFYFFLRGENNFNGPRWTEASSIKTTVIVIIIKFSQNFRHSSAGECSLHHSVFLILSETILNYHLYVNLNLTLPLTKISEQL